MTQMESVIAEKVESLNTLVSERNEEIARLNANPATRSKTTYEPVDADVPSHVNAAEKANAGSGAKAYLDLGIIRKVTVAGTKTESKLGGIDRKINDTLASIKQAIFSQKPATRSRGTGNGGSHAITKAWFEKHANECPAAMGVAWDDQANKITYNLPKGGRGATVSHGALNNILKAYKNAPVTVSEPAPEPKKVPAKKSHGKKQ